MPLMKKTFTGRFHGEMLVFRWRNRHVGLLMEPGGRNARLHRLQGPRLPVQTGTLNPRRAKKRTRMQRNEGDHG